MNNQIIQVDLPTLKIVESLSSFHELDELLEFFLSELVKFRNIRKTEVYLFGKKKRLIPVAEAVSVKKNGRQEIETRIQTWLLDSPIRHSSRRKRLPNVRPVFSIPMLNSEELLGFLNIYFDSLPNHGQYQVGRFYLLAISLAAKVNELHLKTEIENLKSQLQQMVIHNRDALNQVTTLSKELYAVSAISTKVNQSIDLVKSLSKSASKIKELFGAYGVLVFLRKTSGKKLSLVVSEFDSQLIRDDVKNRIIELTSREFLKEVAEAERPVIQELDRPIIIEEGDPDKQEFVKVMLGLPFMAKKRNIGVLIIFHKSASTFRQESLRLLSGLTNIMGMAIENMSLYNQRVQKENEAAFLYKSISKFSETLDLKGTLMAVAQRGAEYIGRNCEVYVLTETREPFVRVQYKKGRTGPFFLSESHKIIYPQELHDFYRMMMEQNMSLIIRSISHSKKLPEHVKKYFITKNIKGLICVPLEMREKKVGILMICQSRTNRMFDVHDLSVAKALGRAAAVAVQNASTFLASVELSDFLEEKIREKTTLLQQIIKEQQHRVNERNDIVFRINKRNRFVFVNKAMEALSGHSRDEFYRGEVLAQDVVAPEDWERVREMFLKVMTKEIPMIKDLEYCHLGSDGEKHVISLTVYPQKDGSGRIIGLEGVGRDVTERVRLQQELKKAKDLAMLGEFSAAIAHQIRNPVSDILMGINLIQKSLKMQGGGEDITKSEINEGLRSEKLSQIFSNLTESINNLNQIVSELLEYTKTLRPSLSLQKIDIILREVLAFFSDLMITKNIVLEESYDESLPEIKLDAVLISQVFQNVIHNAIQAMPTGGILSISTRFSDEKKEYILISVTDSGPGINPEDLDKIFRPFFTTKSSGIGLGLSLSFRIIQAHNGTIWAENNPTSGATFHIKLPVVI